MRVGKRQAEGGQSGLLMLLVVAVAVVAAGFRYWHMGDLGTGSKIVEATVWFVGTLAGGAALIFLGRTFLTLTPGPVRRRPGGREGVQDQDLSAYESEMPEMQSPEIEGIKGTPPEELAGALRNLSGRDDK